MTFTSGIPRSGQSLGNSRPQVQGNFDYIDTAFAINHVAFNASGVGKHKFLQMPEQGSAPSTAANEGALYTKEASSITNLFWRQESSGTEVQMTNIAPSSAQNGYTFLPGGMLMQWNNVSLGASGSATTVTLPTSFTLAGVKVNPYSVVVTANCSVGAALSLSLCVGGFDANNDTFEIRRAGGIGGVGVINAYYIAIGPKT